MQGVVIISETATLPCIRDMHVKDVILETLLQHKGEPRHMLNASVTALMNACMVAWCRQGGGQHRLLGWGGAPA